MTFKHDIAIVHFQEQMRFSAGTYDTLCVLILRSSHETTITHISLFSSSNRNLHSQIILDSAHASKIN